MAEVKLDGGELMDQLTISLRMPRAFGFRMWIAGRLIALARAVSLVPIEARISDDDDAFRFDGHMHRIDVRPGDKFVLKMERAASLDVREKMGAMFKKFAGEDADLLILDAGLSLSVLRQDASGQQR